MKRKEMQELDDNDLVRLYQQGNQAAFEVFYQRHHLAVGKRIRSLVFKFYHDGIEDLENEIWFTISKYMKTFEFRSKFSTYMYTILRSRCMNFSRDTRARNRHQNHLVTVDEIYDHLCYGSSNGSSPHLNAQLCDVGKDTSLLTDAEAMFIGLVHDTHFDRVCNSNAITTEIPMEHCLEIFSGVERDILNGWSDKDAVKVYKEIDKGNSYKDVSKKLKINEGNCKKKRSLLWKEIRRESLHEIEQYLESKGVQLNVN